MKLLALETSTEACSAALYIDGVINECFELAPKIHTRRLLPMIDSLMAEAQLRPQQLDAIAFSRGPGSFTGVRIATGVMQGIALGADLPVVPVSTLAALAQAYFDAFKLSSAFTALDARIGEVFWGIYHKSPEGYAELFAAECVTPPGVVELPNELAAGVGSGWGAYRELLLGDKPHQIVEFHPDALPRASAIAKLGVLGYQTGLAVDVTEALPVYLRDKVAKTEAERLLT